MTEPLKFSRSRAHERRSEFGAKARALAGAVSLPTRPYKKTGLSAARMGQVPRQGHGKVVN